MPRNWVVAAAIIGLLGVTGCGTQGAAPASDPRVEVADLLPAASDFAAGAEVYRLDRDDQMILSLNIHTQSDIGLDTTRVLDPAVCESESLYADQARARLIENGSATAVQMEGGGGYVVLVSEAETDVSRVVEAHTGQCSSYTVTATGLCETSQRTIRTERLDLPPALAGADAAILSEVSHPDNPNWSDTRVLMGYAAVGGYTVVQIGYDDADATQPEFNDVFTQAVEKVRRLGMGTAE